MAVLETEIEIRCEPARLFEFVNAPANRLRVSPPSVRLELLDAPDELSEGCQLRFEVQAYGQRQKFLHEIVEWEHLVGFTENQIEGPFGSMRHERRVVGSEAGSRFVERVEFTPPGGLLGVLLNESRIRGMLTDGFEHQHRELRRLLEGDA